MRCWPWNEARRELVCSLGKTLLFASDAKAPIIRKGLVLSQIRSRVLPTSQYLGQGLGPSYIISP